MTKAFKMSALYVIIRSLTTFLVVLDVRDGAATDQVALRVGDRDDGAHHGGGVVRVVDARLRNGLGRGEGVNVLDAGGSAHRDASAQKLETKLDEKIIKEVPDLIFLHSGRMPDIRSHLYHRIYIRIVE